MSNKASKVPSNNTVPRWAFTVIEGLLDVLGNVLLNVVLPHSLLRDLDGLALHLFAHVGGLDLGWGVLARARCGILQPRHPPARFADCGTFRRLIKLLTRPLAVKEAEWAW